jgi:tight adherence protein B
MSVLSLLLLAVLLLTSAVSLVVSLVMSRRARRDLDHRVTLVVGEDAEDKIPTKPLARASGRLLAELRAVFSLGMARRWGIRSSGPKLLAISLVALLAVWLLFHVALHFSNWSALSLAFATAFLIPRMLVGMEQHRTELAFMDSFPAAIDMVVRMLRAGVPVTAAIRAVGREAPSPVNAVFSSLADQVEIGIAFEDALNAAGERIGLADFRFFAVAISLQRTSGGNLVSTLETLSDIIRRRRGTRLKAQAATAEVRMSTYIIAAIPFFIIGGLMVLSPAYLRPLIVDPRGNVIVALAIGMLLAGFAVMRQMMRSAMRL